MADFRQAEKSTSDSGDQTKTGCHRDQFWVGYVVGLVSMLMTLILLKFASPPLEGPYAPASAPSASSSPIPSAGASVAMPDTVMPEAASCFQAWVCDCKDEMKACFDQNLKHYVICSKGLVLTFEEFDGFGYGDDLYRNACRPAGWPMLNSCFIGRACDEQSLMNREMCISDDDRLAICNNGRVLDFSNPKARRLVKNESCEDPPPCAARPGPEPISL